MGFIKREVVDNFVTIGESEGDVTRVGGILTRFVDNRHFAKPKTDYEFVNKEGDLAVLSGSASLARQIHGEDLGKFFKAEFEGWGKSANGAFKKIAVYIWDGEPTENMKKWPRFAEFFGKQLKTEAVKVSNGEKGNGGNRSANAPAKDDFEDFHSALEDDDSSDLPF